MVVWGNRRGVGKIFEFIFWRPRLSNGGCVLAYRPTAKPLRGIQHRLVFSWSLQEVAQTGAEILRKLSLISFCFGNAIAYYLGNLLPAAM
jgi:hypothetical protein